MHRFLSGLFARPDSDSKTRGMTQIKSVQVKSAQVKFACDSCRAANPPYMAIDCAGDASCGRDMPPNWGLEAKQRQ
jgi:hypothetical protein